jgi:CubicO group peptidase (beta-lactamase class C family)
MAMTALATPATAAEREPFDRAVAAVESRMALVDDIEDVIPGRYFVAVQRDRAPVINVRGATRADGGREVSADTPFYIASMTKAFVGLMAVRLDRTGVMPLDARLGDVFPDMAVAGIDMRTITMQRLLTHQLGFRAPALNIRTAYTDLVPIADYPAIVSAAGATISEPFRYDNLGYLLYAAALEKRTGRSWRSWIEDAVFDPLDMQHSSARASDFADVSHLHERFADGWRTYPPKTDTIMHAAGGLVMSAGDMAKWLRANAGGNSNIPAAIFRDAQAAQVGLDLVEGSMRCTGYTFGWRRCQLAGETILEHGGGYTGMRGSMIVMPERGAGFAVVFNSDSMTGSLSGQLVQTFVMAFAGREAELPSPQEFAARYSERAAGYRAARTREEAESRAQPRWGGWKWKPPAAELVDYSGSYRHPAMGGLDLSVEQDRLVGRLNGRPLSLEPARRDLFAARLADSELRELRFERTSDGAIRRLVFDDMQFDRQPN